MTNINPKHKKAADAFIEGFDIDKACVQANCRPSAFANELSTDGSSLNSYVNEKIDRQMLAMSFFTGDCLKNVLVGILVDSAEDTKDRLHAARLLLSVGLDPRDAMAKFDTLLEAIRPTPQNPSGSIDNAG